MMKKYTGIFKARYTLKGRAWIRDLSPEDLQVFINIGMQAWDYGRLGGLSHSREHLRRIGRIGGIVTSSKRFWNRLLLEEMEREGIL